MAGRRSWTMNNAAGRIAKKVQIDGIWFDSKSEGRRYEELKLMQRAGEIFGLECHPKWDFSLNGRMVIDTDTKRRIKAVFDFSYLDKNGELVVEDVKPFKKQKGRKVWKPILTPEYRLKRALMLACHNITVVEVRA